MLRLLLRSGVDPVRTKVDGRELLHIATITSKLDAAEILLAHQAILMQAPSKEHQPYTDP